MTTPLVGKRQTRKPREGSWASRGAPGHLFCPSRAATLPRPFSCSAPLVGSRTHRSQGAPSGLVCLPQGNLRRIAAAAKP